MILRFTYQLINFDRGKKIFGKNENNQAKVDGKP